MILVTGGTGLLGKSLSRLLPGVYLGSSDCDLRSKESVNRCFDLYAPKVVVHLAARVGGIIDNSKYQYDYFYDNVMMNVNVVDACLNHKIDRLIAISSTCVYPEKTESYPMTEDMVHDGMPEKTSLTYAYSKRMLQVQMRSLPTNSISSVILYPSNLYGSHDKFGERAHLVPALINKMHKAKMDNVDHVMLYGTGKPLRQFTFVDDVSKVIEFFVGSKLEGEWNVATPENLSVLDIARAVARVVGYQGDLRFNGQLDGQFRKDVSTEKLRAVYSGEFTKLEDGLERTYEWYKSTLEIDE